MHHLSCFLWNSFCFVASTCVCLLSREWSPMICSKTFCIFKIMNIRIIFLLLSNCNNLAEQRTISNLFREHNLTILPQVCHLKRAIFQKMQNPVRVVHECNHRTWEAAVGGFPDWGQRGYIESYCLRKKILGEIGYWKDWMIYLQPLECCLSPDNECEMCLNVVNMHYHFLSELRRFFVLSSPM